MNEQTIRLTIETGYRSSRTVNAYLSETLEEIAQRIELKFSPQDTVFTCNETRVQPWRTVEELFFIETLFFNKPLPEIKEVTVSLTPYPENAAHNTKELFINSKRITIHDDVTEASVIYSLGKDKKKGTYCVWLNKKTIPHQLLCTYITRDENIETQKVDDIHHPYQLNRYIDNLGIEQAIGYGKIKSQLNYCYSPILQAVSEADYESIKTLLADDSTKITIKAIKYAIAQRRADIIKIISTQCHIHVKFSGDLLKFFRKIVSNNDLPTFKALLSSIPRISDRLIMGIFCDAVQQGKIETFIDTLVNVKPTLSFNGCPAAAHTYLHIFCYEYYPKSVIALLKQGVDPNREDRDGVTPIRIAIKNAMNHETTYGNLNGPIEIILDLILHGASIPPLPQEQISQIPEKINELIQVGEKLHAETNKLKKHADEKPIETMYRPENKYLWTWFEKILTTPEKNSPLDDKWKRIQQDIRLRETPISMFFNPVDDELAAITIARPLLLPQLEQYLQRFRF